MEKRKMTKQLLEQYTEYLKSEEKSMHTVEKYVRDVQRFRKFAAARQINKPLTIEYKAFLEREYALASSNSMIAALNSFLRFVGWTDCCVKQFKVQRKTYCSQKIELTKSEYLSLVKSAERVSNKRLSLLIQTICATGIRVSEVQYITVEAVRRGEAIVSCKGKTRTVFIVSALCKKLLQYAKKQGILSGMIFVTKNGKALNRSNIWREMKALGHQTGVLSKKIFPHNLRHLFARTFYAIEKDIAKLADILGHSNINTTRIYIVSTGAEHRRRMENMRLII